MSLSPSRPPLCHSWQMPDFSPRRHLWTHLQGCKAFGELSRAVVERRQAQAAELVERGLPAAGRSGTGCREVELRLPACLRRQARQQGWSIIQRFP